MGFISVENEVEQAIQMVNGENSTDTKVVLQIANYKEELEKLKGEAGEPEAESSGDDEGSEEPETEENDSDEDSDDDGEDGDDEGKEMEDDVEEVTDADVTAAQEAITIMFALENIAGKLKKHATKGGADLVTVKMALECSEILANRIGFRLPKKVSLEALDSFTNRQSNTKIAIEDISDVATEIWEGLKRFFRTMWNWVKEYIFGIKQVCRAQEDALKEIRDANKSIISKLNKYPLTDESIEKLAKITYKAKAHNLTSVKDATVEDVGAAYNDLIRFGDAFSDTIYGLLKNKMQPAVVEMFKGAPNLKLTKVSISESDFRSLSITNHAVGKMPPDMVTLVTKELPGNRFFTIECPNDRPDDPVKASLNTKLYLMSSGNRGSSTSQVASIADASKLDATAVDAQKIDDLIKHVMKLVDSDIKKNKEQLDKILSSNMNIWVNMTPDGLKEIQQDMKNYLKLSMVLFDQPVTAVLTYLSAFLTALEEYIAFSQKSILKVLDAQIKATPQVQ